MQDVQVAAQAPWYLWVVGIVALLWNGFGVVLWGGTSFAADSFLADAPAVQRAYVAGLPLWSTVTWGLGVVGGLVGSILLLLRHRLAVAAFAVSAFGAVVNNIVYLTDPPPPGFFSPWLVVFIIGFALFLLWFALRLRRRGVLG